MTQPATEHLEFCVERELRNAKPQDYASAARAAVAALVAVGAVRVTPRPVSSGLFQEPVEPAPH